MKLQNIGDQTISLGGAQFDEGISFDFPDLELGPGEVAYVASDAAGFAARYGAGLNLIGEYDGQLSNGGERVRLEVASLSAGILDFEYDDDWFPETDGAGPSLLIVDPTAPPSSWSEASSWQPSEVGDAQSYDEWAEAIFGAPQGGVTGKTNDPDFDGIPNLLEFVLMLDPKSSDPASATPQVEVQGGLLTLTYTTAHLPPDIVLNHELSDDLIAWQVAPPEKVSVRLISDDGTARTYRATLLEPVGDVSGLSRRFMRLQALGE